MSERYEDWLDDLETYRYADEGDYDPWDCMGAACLCPHFLHRRSECFTLEDAREWDAHHRRENRREWWRRFWARLRWWRATP